VFQTEHEPTACHSDRAAHEEIWFKALDPLPDDGVLHRSLLAYASDYYLLGTASLDSPTASSSRGFALGKIYSQDGRLVASTAQEGLIRRRR
jgi:acyl-CoA thioesterase-2